MSVESIGRALNLTDERLDPTAKFLLVAIANHDGDGGAWPSMATLSRYLGVSVRSVQRWLQRLIDLGYVTVSFQGGGTAETRSDRRPNLYKLHFDGVSPASPRVDDGVTPVTQRGDAGDQNGVTPTSPEPSLNRPEPPANSPVDILEVVVDMAARRIVEHREEMGYGVGGPGALKKAVGDVDVTLAAQWLMLGFNHTEIARCLAARVTDRTTPSPSAPWVPPPPEVEPESLERARELLGSTNQSGR